MRVEVAKEAIRAIMKGQVENAVELIKARMARRIGESVPGDGDQADLLGVEIDRHDHIGVRMGHGPAGGSPAFKRIDAK